MDFPGISGSGLSYMHLDPGISSNVESSNFVTNIFNDVDSDC